MSEVPFPQPMDAVLTEPPPELSDPDGVGWITFIDPKHGRRTSVPVRRGPTRQDHPTIGNVWHIEFDGDEAVTFPSIHHPGNFHTPYRCRWRIVDQLPDELVPCPVCAREPGEAHDGAAHLAKGSDDATP